MEKKEKKQQLRLLLKEFKIISSNTDNLNRNNLPIAFFDSGVGGLTVLKELKKILPNEDYLYFGDTKNMPYGEKTKEQLIELADTIFKFFEEMGVKAVVMACNTTSATTYEELKDNYNFKVYPIIQSVTSVIAKSDIKRLGVFATHATINSHAYSCGIQKHNSEMKVFEIACPEWVRIVEENKANQPQSIIQVQEKMEEMIVHKPEKIILGCTHYPYLINILKKFAPVETFIDPAVSFAEYIKNDLEINGLTNSKPKRIEKFYVSSSPQNFEDAGKMFYTLQSFPIFIK